MPITPVSSFALDARQSLRRGAGDLVEDCPALLHDGTATGVHLSPGTIAAQFACALGYLLFVDGEGCESESAGDVYLLSPDLKVTDAASLTVWYTPGCFEDVRVVGDRAVDFRLAIPWRLRLRDSPRRIPQHHEWMGWPVARPKDHGPLRRYMDFERRWRRGDKTGASTAADGD